MVASQWAEAQSGKKDTLMNNWTSHVQITVISQQHTAFRALYSGKNSLADTVEPIATSVTSTLFLGRQLWKGAAFYFNPELSAGNGLSFASGVAGALNGETYRVGAVQPQVFIARAYLQQYFSLGNSEYEYVSDDQNQVAEKVPVNRFTLRAGKFAISDFFDDNAYSKDPRTQFLNWSLWANGAWDYPANTRGYTYGFVAEVTKRNWSLRFSSVAVPRIANNSSMEYKLSKANGETVEYERRYRLGESKGKISAIASAIFNRSPSYSEGLKAIADSNIFLLNVISGKAENNKYGGSKYVLGLNIEQEITDDIGLFSRIGWNDGKYVSWAFTEIDRTANIGLSINGKRWKRPDDLFGIASVVNGISSGHRAFLKAGGYGFIIGDGNLNYGHESVFETFYNAKLTNFFWVTFDYQFVKNPGYNKDRGDRKSVV